MTLSPKDFFHSQASEILILLLLVEFSREETALGSDQEGCKTPEVGDYFARLLFFSGSPGPVLGNLSYLIRPHPSKLGWGEGTGPLT